MTRRVAPLRAAPPRYGLTWRTYVVNAPAGFTAAWAIIKLFLDPVVCRKVARSSARARVSGMKLRPRFSPLPPLLPPKVSILGELGKVRGGGEAARARARARKTRNKRRARASLPSL